MTDKPTKPTVSLVRSSYQPSRAELEEPIEFPEGTTPEDLAKAVMKTVTINKRARPE
ncbi:MAG: hypothetical protein OXQ29_23320 [Rhodospirillaceae bacterium]|nr:hypothetical protein [Rhodospirillaceae bacterium]